MSPRDPTSPGDPHFDAFDPMPMLDHRSGLSALKHARSSRRTKALAWVLSVLFVLMLLGLAFLPWQQFVQGSGRVVAYDPLERAIIIEAPLAGKVQRTKIFEGQSVKQGDVLFEIRDNDPDLLDNLRKQQASALARMESVKERERSLSAQIREIERSIPLAIESARTRLDAAQYGSITAQQQFERIEGLFEDPRGLASQRDFELAKLERDRARAELARAEADLGRAEVDLNAAMNQASAGREAASADLAAAEQAVVDLDILVNQTGMQRIHAPRDGIVFRVQATEGSFLRAGSPVCTIIPETANRTVELWLSGNDMPLLQAREIGTDGRVLRAGSPVRLQFEGWPAIQFVGWPSAAIGTFGGEVLLVDPTDNGKGVFRVLVTAKPDVVVGIDGKVRTIDWPGNRWLRQGSRANGWILLQRVPLWFEVWRQMNGFPPALSEGMLDGES